MMQQHELIDYIIRNNDELKADISPDEQLFTFSEEYRNQILSDIIQMLTLETEMSYDEISEVLTIERLKMLWDLE